MPKNSEKSPDNVESEKSSDLEKLFLVKLGVETSVDRIRESFRDNKYVPMRVFVTDDFNIYLSHAEHSEMEKANGLSDGIPFEVMRNASGQLYLAFIYDASDFDHALDMYFGSLDRRAVCQTIENLVLDWVKKEIPT